MSGKKMTMGVIVGNRGFFPDQLAKSGREEMIQALTKAGMDSVVLGPEDSKHGAVETHEEAKRCAALFQKNRDKIDGVIVSLPNFGDERAIADTMRLARARCSRPRAGYARRRCEDDHPASPRQLLRKDVGLQQPAPVWHPVFADQASHRKPRTRNDFRERSGLVCGGMPRGQRHAQPARRQHRRAPHRIQYRALQRKAARSPRHLHRDTGSVGSLRPHRQAERRSRGRAGQTRRHSQICHHQRSAGCRAHQDGEARLRDRRLDDADRCTASAPCNAGRRWKNTSASFPAPS